MLEKRVVILLILTRKIYFILLKYFAYFVIRQLIYFHSEGILPASQKGA